MNWTPLLTSSGAATLLGFVIKDVIKAYKSYRERRAKRYFTKVSELFQILKRPLSETVMDRWTVIKVHNGGKRLNLLSETFYSFLYEDYKPNLKPRIKDYQKIVVDKYYNDLFDQARAKGSVIITPADMQDGNSVKDMCEIDGIKHSLMFFLMGDDTSLFFLDFSSNEYPHEMVESHDMALLRRSYEQVRSLFIKNMI